MTCLDCLHCRACDLMYEHLTHKTVPSLSEYPDGAETCKAFEDKNAYIPKRTNDWKDRFLNTFLGGKR